MSFLISSDRQQLQNYNRFLVVWKIKNVTKSHRNQLHVGSIHPKQIAYTDLY